MTSIIKPNPNKHHQKDQNRPQITPLNRLKNNRIFAKIFIIVNLLRNIFTKNTNFNHSSGNSTPLILAFFKTTIKQQFRHHPYKINATRSVKIVSTNNHLAQFLFNPKAPS